MSHMRILASALEIMRGPACLVAKLQLDESRAMSPAMLARTKKFNRIVRAARELGEAIDDLERGDKAEVRQ